MIFYINQKFSFKYIFGLVVVSTHVLFVQKLTELDGVTVHEAPALHPTVSVLLIAKNEASTAALDALFTVTENEK